MRNVSIGMVALAGATFVLAAQATGQTPALPAPPKVTTPAAAAATGELPPGPGHDTMVRVCSTCHAPEIAAQQRLSKDAWHEMVDVMASRGAQGSEQDFADITAYLAKNFPDTPAK